MKESAFAISLAAKKYKEEAEMKLFQKKQTPEDQDVLWRKEAFETLQQEGWTLIPEKELVALATDECGHRRDDPHGFNVFSPCFIFAWKEKEIICMVRIFNAHFSFSDLAVGYLPSKFIPGCKTVVITNAIEFPWGPMPYSCEKDIALVYIGDRNNPGVVKSSAVAWGLQRYLREQFPTTH